MPSVLRDALHALRSWRAQPVVIAVAVMALAVGIGVNVVVFGLVEALILRPLPAVESAGDVQATRRNPFSYQAYRAFSDRQRSFQRTAAWQSLTVSLVAGDGAQPAEALFVSSDYFAVLGLTPSRGRLLGPADEQRPDALVAVISERCWHARFDSAGDVVGRTVTIDRTPVAIVGVVGGSFAGTELGTPADLFLPVTGFDGVRGVTGPRAWLTDPSVSWLQAIVRLRPGADAAAARVDAEGVFRSVGAAIPSYRSTTLDLVPLADAAFPGFARDSSRRVMFTLFGVAACVLLIACANVATLLLALGERRRLEWGVRLALGVGRTRLAAQLLAETVPLVAVSSGAGLVLARGAFVLLSTVRLTADVPITLTGVLDLRVTLAAVAVAGITTLACGLAPAWHGARTDVVSLLGRGTGALSRPSGATLRDVLVAAQVGVSVLLVVGAVSFVTTLRKLEGLPAGFKAAGVAMLRVNVRLAGYTPNAGVEFYRRLDQRVASLAGIVAASRALNEPLGANAYVRSIGLAGGVTARQVMNTVVTPRYFDVLGIPIVEGQDFDATSPAGSVIVNETLAHQLWPGKSAVGQALQARDRGSQISRVIGVVRDSKYHTLQEDSSAFLYTHAADDYDATQVVFARGAGNAAVLLGGLRQAVHDVDPRVPILALTTLRDHVASTLSQPKAAAGLVTTLAGLAALLAAVGLHAALAFVVSARRREMAIRMALGARRRHLVAALAERSGLAVAAGLASGLAGAVALERIIAGLLYGVSPADPGVLILAGTIGVAVAVAAAAGPVLRAIGTAPATALKD